MKALQETRIEHLRTVFRTGTGAPSAAEFAANILKANQDAIRKEAIVPVAVAKILDVRLGDPTRPVGRPVLAYVNAGRWLAKCECGGCEYVDLETLVFMCCHCWNAAIKHQWRRIEMPSRLKHRTIERILLARKDARTRNWQVHETTKFLEGENVKHGLPIRARLLS